MSSVCSHTDYDGLFRACVDGLGDLDSVKVYHCRECDHILEQDWNLLNMNRAFNIPGSLAWLMVDQMGLEGYREWIRSSDS